MKYLKSILILVFVVITFTLVGCASTKDSSPQLNNKDTKTFDAPIFDPVVKTDNENDDFNIYIMHTSDTKSNFFETPSSIGYSKLATIVKEGRKLTEYNLLLDAGNSLSGSLISDITKGAAAAVLMNAVGYDAIALNGDDFKYPINELEKFSYNTKMKILSLNVLGSDDKFQSYQIYTFDNLDIAVIGLTKPIKGVTNINDNIINSLQDVVDNAHKLADFVVVLGSFGTASDFSSTMICQYINGIDLFIDGSNKDALEESISVNGTLIVTSGENLNSIGLVELKVVNKKVVDVIAKVIKADELNLSDIKKDENIEELFSLGQSLLQAYNEDVKL